MMKKFIVRVRYNTNYPATSDKKWRLLVGDVQHLVDEIELRCKAFTTTDIVKGDDGQDVTKYHISCKSKNVEFQTKKGITKAIIK
jgi:hypothetical protein